MIAQELFEKYPKAGKVVVEYFTKIFMDSLNNEDITDEFKEMAKTEVLNSEYIQDFIEGNPRGLFDVFDANNVYIEILVDYSKNEAEFTYGVIDDDEMNTESTMYKSRIEAEKVAVDKAFQILNEKL